MSDELLDLPEGWELVKFEEVINLKHGHQFRKNDFVSSGIPVVKIGQCKKDGTLDLSKCDFIADYRKEEFKEFKVSKGDILMALTGGTLGKVTEVQEDYGFIVQNYRVGNFIPNEKFIFRGFIPNILRSSFFQTLVRENINQSAQPNIGKENIDQLLIPLPPLNEQKRIVAKIEELNDRSQTAQKALVTIPQLCDRFRQSVLAAAFSGDLTADWREKNPDVEWKELTLEDVIKSKPRNGYSPKPVEYPTNVKSLTLSATTSGNFKPEHFKYIDEEIPPDSHLWLSPGDILIQRGNSLEYVGTSAIYDSNCKEFIYPDLMMKIQVVEEKAKSEFIHYFLSSKATKEYFKQNATGTAGNMPKINQQIVINTPILLPPLEEQKQIVSLIEKYFKIIDNIEQQYKQTKEKLEKLDQSILSKAFRGELVPQDPNDEPAAKLLERIREEREKTHNNKPKNQRQRKTPKNQTTIPGLQ